jgi:carbamoyltransferase
LNILGVWDGHDSGAALIVDGKIVYAANEERFTKRKLEIKFPRNSILAALKYANMAPSDVQNVAFSTTELTKTIERVFPGMKENYYHFRRRKTPKPSFVNLRHKTKYTLTSIGRVPLSDSISRSIVTKELRSLGLTNFKLHTVDHHTAHAATAAFTSGMRKSLVITIDGLGDGLSGSVSTLQDGKLTRHIAIPARDSIGIFYEQATNILGMRELEDEGKVMAMADYSYPFKYEENPLASLFTISGTIIKAKYNPAKQFDVLHSIAWQMPKEQFAYMVQQILENLLIKVVSNSVDRFGIGDICLSGGVFSNVKANMMLRNLQNVNHWYIFPHMGDGGLALGAALYTNYLLDGKSDFSFSPYLGNEYSEDYTEKVMKENRDFTYQKESGLDSMSHIAELIAAGNYLMLFQGRMEYGPRALCNRSIIAPASSEETKEKLNLYVKRREWFQPFAPSMLNEEVGRLLEYDGKGVPKFMTMAYAMKKEYAKKNSAVVHVDGTARPQIVDGINLLMEGTLKKLKEKTGDGMVLNTSFNIHGLPIVMNPEDAIATMRETKTKYMFINGLFVTNRRGA